MKLYSINITTTKDNDIAIEQYDFLEDKPSHILISKDMIQPIVNELLNLEKKLD